jgi:hypothetical protein
VSGVSDSRAAALRATHDGDKERNYGVERRVDEPVGGALERGENVGLGHREWETGVVVREKEAASDESWITCVLRSKSSAQIASTSVRR